MKKLLFLFAVLLTSIGAWAAIDVSTDVDAPENTYSLLSKNGAYMSAGTGSTQFFIGRFAFFAADGENAYKIYSVDGKKWVSYTKADSYGGGPNKATLVASQETAEAWNVVANGNYYNIAPLKNDGTLGGQYWNFHGGAGASNKTYIYDDNKTVGFYDQAGDGGSLWTLEKLTLATEEQVNAAKAFIGEGLGYPKTSSSVYAAMNALAFGTSTTKHVDVAKTAYLTTNDVQLPEDGEAYTIANYTKTEKTRYLNYTSGSALSVKEGNANASVFVCRELSAGVYAFVTEDGKVLTWMGGADGFTAEGSRKGYSSEYGMEQNGLYDWNKITVKSNRNTSDGTDLGHLRLVARRSSSYPSASWVVNVPNDNWNNNSSDGYNFDGNHSSAWIFTKVEHINTPEQEQALAKIATKLQIEGMKLGSYCLIDKSGNKLTNLKTAFDAVNTAENQDEINTLLASRTLDLPTAGKAYYLKDSQGTYLDIHHLVVEANDRQNSTQLASLSKTKQILYITGSETDGTWKIHTTPEGGKYLHQKTSDRTWNSWVSDAGGDFKWEVEGIDVSGTPHYMLKNISGKENGYLGPNNNTHTTAGEPLFVNQKSPNERHYMKMQLLPVNSITGLASTAGEWLSEECVDVAAVEEIPEGIKNLSNYNDFVDANYTHKVVTSGEHFYINAGRLTGLFSWRSGSGSKRVNIVAVEVVDLAGAVVDADYHWGYAGNPSSDNTYSVDVPEDGLYYLRYYAETASNGGVNDSDVDITYTLVEKNVDCVEEFVQGGVYTFVTSLGWMGATAESSNVISTARTNVAAEDKSADNPYFQWTVYKSNNGNYYLYNIGKKMFMGVQSTGNASVPFTENPAGKTLTFKEGNKAGYPILFSTDNKGSVNHSTNFGEGLITWSGGWNDLTDNGNSHQVTLVSQLPAATLQEIANKVEAYDKRLYVRAEVEGSWEDNPNTHFGSVTATTSAGTTLKTTLKTNPSVATVDYDGLQETTIDFTRDYRGFEFQGYSFGGVDLGKSFTLTDEQKASITAENPLIAKFTATEAVTLFYDDDPFSYRIPAIATTSTGRLIAVSDYRYSLDDIGRYNYGTATPGIDLVIRTSDDNGKTWSETKTIAKGSCVRGTDDCAYGDAAIAVVGQKVLVMGAAGDVMFGDADATAHNRTVRILSEDNGETWSQPKDISETLFIGNDATIPNSFSTFFGSGRLAVDVTFVGTPEKPRIYGAMLLRKEGSKGVYVIYTDDLGLTWKTLGGSVDPIATSNVDEPKVEILPSGKILLSIRRQGGGGRIFNVFTYGTEEGDPAKGTGTWDTNVNGCGNDGSNSTNGEIYCIDAKKPNGTAVKLLLQSQPKGGSGMYDRRDVTIWYKEVDNTDYTSEQIASNWIQGLQVSTQQSAYSAMTLQEDGKIAFFFEEAPCFGDDQGKGYCMVYLPLTIESITKGNYFSPTTDLNATQTISVVLTDAQGNEYRDQVESTIAGVAAALTTKYPFITLGDNVNLSMENGAYTYTNTVTLPFKVSNEENTYWHNIYTPSNSGKPVYLSATESSDQYVPKVTENDAIYGNSQYNTLNYAPNINWAVYNVNQGFTFKFKNNLTDKYIRVTSVADGDAQNAEYVAESDATAFEIRKDGNLFLLVAEVEGKVGYLGSTSARNYHFATHYKSIHDGAKMKFDEAPDFDVLISEASSELAKFTGEIGMYKVTEAVQKAKTAMGNSATVKLNDLNAYKGLSTNATVQEPVNGLFYRLKNVATNMYLIGNADGTAKVSNEDGVAKSAISVFYVDNNNKLLSYNAGRYFDCNAKALATIGTSHNGLFGFAHDIPTPNVITYKNNGKWTYGGHEDGHLDFSSYSASANGYDWYVEPVTSLPFTFKQAALGFATFNAPVAVEIPTGVLAYVADVDEENSTLKMYRLEGNEIPAETPVLLYNESAKTANQNVDIKIVDSYAGNEGGDISTKKGFYGTVAAETYPENTTVYSLQKNTAGTMVGFYQKANTTTLAGFKAWVKIAGEPTAEGRAFTIIFDGDDATGLKEALGIENENVEIYDLSGRRLDKPTKGINVVGGKLVIK